MSVTLNDNSKAVLAAMERAQEAALIKIGIAAKRNIQGVVTDKGIYDTGELHRTIDYDVRADDGAVDIGSPKKYAAYQELGTRFIGARPFVRPGIFDNIGEYETIAGEEITAKMEDPY